MLKLFSCCFFLLILASICLMLYSLPLFLIFLLIISFCLHCSILDIRCRVLFFKPRLPVCLSSEFNWHTFMIIVITLGLLQLYFVFFLPLLFWGYLFLWGFIGLNFPEQDFKIQQSVLFFWNSESGLFLNLLRLIMCLFFSCQFLKFVSVSCFLFPPASLLSTGSYCAHFTFLFSQAQ